MDSKEYLKDQFQKFILKGGKRVSKENEEARIFEGCKRGSNNPEDWCPFYGIVEPIPKLELTGCTRCGCPDITKAKMDTYYRIHDDDRDLTATELFMIKVGKAIGVDLKEVKLICKHPEGNMWELIDKKFKK